MTREEHLAAIKQADHEYYDLDNPTLSDAEYDKLRRSYIDQYGTEDLNYVPGNVSEGFEKFKHPTPVTSLGKWTKGVDDEKDLLAQVEKLWPVEVQLKYDGLTVVAYPNTDGSCKYVTRGLGGEVGEILPNFIPKYEGTGINNSDFAIRGEVYITPANFERLNSALEYAGEEPMKNIRNAAAGLLRRKERSPYLNLLSYTVYDLPGQDMTPAEMRKIVSEQTQFTFADGFGYETVEDTVTGIEQVYNDINSLQTYPIDGMVIKSCQQNSGYRFGNTAHHPRNAFAWKALQEEVETVVRDVIWQMGRSKATPVAIVDPVQIDGTTVTRATLHNAAEIKRLGLKIGSTVLLRKANQIIPQITEVIKPGDKDIVLDVCPACGGPLEEVNGQQFCTNPDCKERIAQNIAFLGSKDVLDIPGLSIQTARKIVKVFDSLTDEIKQNAIFELAPVDYKFLPGFGDKSAQKLYDAVQKARDNVELPRFIKALCIPGIGNTVGKILADKYTSIKCLENGCRYACEEGVSDIVKERLLKINGIGEVTAEAILSQEFWEAVDALREYVDIAPYEKPEPVTGDYAGKVFVLTGKMVHPRSYYVEKIEAAGGKEGSAVNSKTDYLVIADVNSTSSKATKARKLGTKLISPEELEDMLK
jgi:DNA ligase (NAD+)